MVRRRPAIVFSGATVTCSGAHVNTPPNGFASVDGTTFRAAG